jgi:capsular polysaccharide transport system permease protein
MQGFRESSAEYRMSDAPQDTRPAAPRAVPSAAGAGPAAPRNGTARPPASAVTASSATSARPAAVHPAAPVLKAVEGGATRPAANPQRPKPAAPRPATLPPQPVQPAGTPATPPPAALRARLRFRHVVLALSFLVCVVLPVAATVLYLYTRAAAQYHSETDFSVRSAEVGASAAAGILGALTMVGGGSASDTDILFDYIRSQEMVQVVDAQLDLRSIYNLDEARDPIFALGDAPSIEDLTRYWNRMVKVDLDTQGGIIHVRANAFTPEDATAIARAILEESSALVNRLSEQAREDAVRFAREELAETEARLKEQRAKIADFRRENRLVDPGADVAGQMGLLNALQGELAKAMVERDQLLSFVGPDDQRVIQAERRIDAIETRIDAERRSLGDESGGTTLTDVVGGYEALKVDLEFAQAAYTQALAAETAARAEARRQSRYLAPHVTPTTAEESLYPRRALLSGLALLFLTLGWGVLMLVYYNVRDDSR